MDIWTPNVLIETVENIVPEYGFLTRMFFPGEQVQATTKVTVDVRKKARRISPFVSPYVQGQIVEKQGFHSFELEPAYIKDKRVFEPNSHFTRTYGEPIPGNLSPGQRLERSVAFELQDQQDMLARRLEVMAGEVLFRGKLTIVGELYPERELDFLRDASLTIDLTGTSEWGDANVEPLDLLDDWAELVFAKSGVRPRVAVMTLDAYKLFRQSTRVLALLNRFRNNPDSNTLQDMAPTEDDGWYAGNIGGWEVYVYNGTYVDPITNLSAQVLPDYTVIIGGSAIRGYKAFGAIRDEKAGLQARKFFSKSWIEEDPPVRYIMMQSAPIMVPFYPDAMLAATVKQ
jgi:hypothetical protein